MKKDMEGTSQTFTVGKMDAGVAILLSDDHNIVEMPANLLPVRVCFRSGRWW